MTKDRTSHRLYVEAPLATDAVYLCQPPQAHYLLQVLRLKAGTHILVFNGFDGEWLAELRPTGKKTCELLLREQTRPQTVGPQIHYLFAPLKHARLDYMIQKAVEMGAAKLQPVTTRRTNVSRLNMERMRANIIEAAEQCGVLRLPELIDETKLDRLLDDWDQEVPIVFCDEEAPIASPLVALSALDRGAPAALLIGPEGGFDDEERSRLRALSFVHAVSLGPRIMRADTAAVAALALLDAVLYDWQ